MISSIQIVEVQRHKCSSAGSETPGGQDYVLKVHNSRDSKDFIEVRRPEWPPARCPSVMYHCQNACLSCAIYAPKVCAAHMKGPL